MKKTLYPLVAFLILVFVSCQQENREEVALTLFKNYYKAVKEDGDKWQYTTDTVRSWWDEKSGEGSRQIKGVPRSGKWKGWDEEMHTTTDYDSIWYDAKENAIRGYFYENNDFYELLGKTPTKSLRTFWFNEEDKIHEILRYWIPEVNTETSVHIKPIQEWAVVNAPEEIEALYPNGRIQPSAENARRWKALIKRYKEATQP